MSNTPNYNLYLTDDSSTRFQEWRNQMNGTENSNMVKIDAALGEKANSSVAINTTLLASAWVGVDAPYTQTLTISGLTASQNGTISVAHNATAEQREIARANISSYCPMRDRVFSRAISRISGTLSFRSTSGSSGFRQPRRRRFRQWRSDTCGCLRYYHAGFFWESLCEVD